MREITVKEVFAGVALCVEARDRPLRAVGHAAFWGRCSRIRDDLVPSIIIYYLSGRFHDYFANVSGTGTGDNGSN